MIRIGVLALLSLLYLPAFAQSQADTARLSEVLDKQNEIMLSTQGNLIEMTSGLPEPEATRVDHITVYADSVQYGTQHLIVLTSLHSKMRDTEDRDLVRGYVTLQARYLLKTTNNALHGLNTNLGRLRSPAAIADVQKLRETIQAIQTRVREAFPKIRPL
jgi:hypothetical protein